MNDYWDIVAKMWGKTTANVVHWIINAMMIAGVLVGVILVVFKIVSGAIALNREQDCGIGQALKEASKPMVKFILLIAIAEISIPLLWNFLFPFLIAQGWNPDTPNNLSNLNFKV